MSTTTDGNRRFRILVELNLKEYIAAKTKMEKTVIVMKILDTIRDGSKVGGFVKQVRLSSASPKRAYPLHRSRGPMLMKFISNLLHFDLLEIFSKTKTRISLGSTHQTLV